MICSFHFDDIAAAVRHYGLGHLVETDRARRDAHAERIMAAPKGEKLGTTRESFEPIWFCSAVVVGNAKRLLEGFGRPFDLDKCALCTVIRGCSCDAWSCSYRKIPWLAAEEARKTAQKLGLVVTPEKPKVAADGSAVPARAPAPRSPATELVGARKILDAALQMDGLKLPADAAVEIATRPDGTRVISATTHVDTLLEQLSPSPAAKN